MIFSERNGSTQPEENAGSVKNGWKPKKCYREQKITAKHQRENGNPKNTDNNTEANEKILTN